MISSNLWNNHSFFNIKFEIKRDRKTFHDANKIVDRSNRNIDF